MSDFDKVYADCGIVDSGSVDPVRRHNMLQELVGGWGFLLADVLRWSVEDQQHVLAILHASHV